MRGRAVRLRRAFWQKSLEKGVFLVLFWWFLVLFSFLEAFGEFSGVFGELL